MPLRFKYLCQLRTVLAGKSIPHRHLCASPHATGPVLVPTRMMEWVQACLLREAILLIDSISKSKVIFPGGVEVGGLITDQGT